MRALVSAALFCMLAAPMVVADVLDELAKKNSFAGSFTQRVVGPDGVVIETATGHFRLMRPDFFWWQIDSPERQLLIAAGDTMTQIDWDLEVVAEREITAETRSALHWLLAPRPELETAFDIEVSDAGVSLTPVSDDHGFLSIAVSRADEYGWILSITDLGYQVLEFSLLENPAIAVDASGFNVPETPF